MRFLIDANLPKALCVWLAQFGHEAAHVLELSLAQAPDADLWALARDRGAVIVSKDEDFADLARRDPSGPAVVWVRTGNGTTAQLLACLGPAWPTIEGRLSAGDRLIEFR